MTALRGIIYPATLIGGGILLFLSSAATYYDLTAPPIWSSHSGLKPSVSLSAATANEFTLEALDKSYPVTPQTLTKWAEDYYRSYNRRRELRLNSGRAKPFVEAIAKEINQAPTNARLNIDSDGRLVEILPASEGRKVNLDRSLANIFIALNRGQNFARLAIDEIKPKVTLEKARALGITQLLGKGQSDFKGSPRSRTHNIGIGAKVFDGLILRPGDEFSFNKVLGPVDAATGYEAELVIKSKKIIPEYGGGLCQVSTTMFRAAMAAGLPILERHPHSLPVRYYNPQGYDATIYPGVSDFRFRNDTPRYLLIQSKIAGASISFEIYGQGDGRQVLIDGPHIYETGPDGSLKAWLKRVVIFEDGGQKKETFYSNYKSPSLYPIDRNPLE